MRKIKRLFYSKNSKGEINIPVLFVMLIVAMLLVAFLPALNTAVRGGNWTISGAIDYLAQWDYYVWAASGLSTNQVAYATSGTALGGSANLTFNGTTLTSTASTITTANITTLNAPTGRGATLVVAASDATATEKAQADYLCDGTADNVEIQAAIDSLASNGHIYLTEGNFTLTDTVNLKSDIKITGSGTATVITQGTANKDTFKATGTALNKVWRLTIGEMYIKGTKPAVGDDGNGIRCVYTADSFFYNLNFWGNGAAGLRFDNCHDNYIINVITDNNGFSGFDIRNSEWCVFSNCDGVLSGQSGIILNTCTHCTIANSDFKSNTWNGITLYASDYNTVVNNQCWDNQKAGGYYNIQETDASSDYNIIKDNIVSIDGGTGATPTVATVGAHTRVANNIGYVTENSGTATVANASTSIVVNHGLAATPTDIQISPAENPTNAVTYWWVDTLTASNFTINVNADPGASNLDFYWRAVVGAGN